MKKLTFALALVLLTIVSNSFDSFHNSIWHFLDVHINCCPCYNIELFNANISNLFSVDLPDIDVDISDDDGFDLDTSDELEDTDLPSR